MNHIDLENIGVKEIDSNMSRNINGGLIWWAIKAYAAALLVEVVVDGWEQCKADFMEGWNS